MKVSEQLLVTRVYGETTRGIGDAPRVIGASAPSTGSSRTTTPVAPPSDKLEFSPTAQTLQRARALIATLPEVRSAVVTAARAAIATGAFPPSAEHIAAALDA
ncbi:MAG: flagellar biosynthesis anti-sigma factor FlgM [Dehalococcoidia bacterium]|nr:flagellar biosynthesis anti-sigma factor FlgM [Dehalococcoidia bacterium]